MGIDPFTVGGYRRNVIVTPSAGKCTTALEDDYHAMVVTITHDGSVITGLTSEMVRVPWSTCPGAAEVISRTFIGVSLQEAAKRGDKRLNCTHLYDLTLLAAAHALDDGPTFYAIAASDKVDGLVDAEIRLNGQPVLSVAHCNDVLTYPEAVVGRTLFDMRDWIAGLPDAATREAARLLQWATIIAHGRALTLEQHGDISRTPASCYTFQEERRHDAVRLPTILDFSDCSATPLAGFDGERFA